MRIARPCFDKYHRCPGWAGSGWTFNKPGKDWCTDGYVKTWDAQRSGGLQFAWKWRVHRCNKCRTYVLPYVIRWLFPSCWKLEWEHWRADRELWR